jgi:hypothetical protein
VRAKDPSDADLTALTGKPRAAIAWRSNTGIVRFGAGTHSKLYALVEGTLTDITPAGFVAGRADSVFSSGGTPGTGSTYGGLAYGSGTYGGTAGPTLARTLLDADTWQLDTWGEELIAVCTSDSKLYKWDGIAANDGVQATGSPLCRAAVVTPERFLVALGAATAAAPSVVQARRVAWASQETTDDWTPGVNNTAGGFELATQGRIMAGRRTRRQTLIWTDCDVHAMHYIGGTLIYAFDVVGENCGLLAPNAVATIGSKAYWMSKSNFFEYDGFVKEIPCDVRDHVFGDINETQMAKCFAVTVSEHNEIWWFYPSANSLEPNKYVIYNYNERHWTPGTLQRSAGVDRGALNFPIMLTSDGLIYEHEILSDRGSEVPYVESGPLPMSPEVMKILRLIPDEKTLGDVQATLYTLLYPMDNTELTHGPYTLTKLTDVRASGRLVRLRLTQAVETKWRVGLMQIAALPGGRR